VTGNRWISADHYSSNLIALQHKATKYLLSGEYAPAGYYFAEAVDTLDTLTMLEDRLKFSKDDSFQPKVSNVACGILRDYAITLLASAAVQYAGVIVGRRSGEKYAKKDYHNGLRLVKDKVTEKILPALAKALKYARYTESSSTMKAELYYRQFVAYMICGDTRRAKVALRAAKGFAPEELKVLMAEDVLNVFEIALPGGLSMALSSVLYPYASAEAVRESSPVRSTDIGVPHVSREDYKRSIRKSLVTLVPEKRRQVLARR
jgi:hypothetical protein